MGGNKKANDQPIFKYVAIHTMKFLMTSTPIKKGAEKKTIKVINSYLVT